MDSAHSHPTSPRSTSAQAQSAIHQQSSTASVSPKKSKRHSEPTASRHTRLLQNRNARFPAKKLSLSNLSSRFSQLIHANDEQPITELHNGNQENASPERPSQVTHEETYASYQPLGTLNENFGSTLKRKKRQRDNIVVFEDTPERPLLARSPFSSPAAYQGKSSEGPSPIGFDQIQDSIGSMRLREISGNESRAWPVVSSPLGGSMKAVKKRKSAVVKSGFDTQEYIEHIEQELAEARNEMFSPTTNRSLRDQLILARQENEKLKRDMNCMRNMFEMEVKKTIEHKVEMEVELKRKVRDLEDELEQKVSVIKDLELQHDERRLNDNTIDNLRAAIEKLEKDKLSLEQENRGMSKRNDVLSELVALSPTKVHSMELRSPIREKRGTGRPMSMIIPRLPSSPTGRQLSQPPSAAVSPSLSIHGSGIFKQRTESMHSSNQGLGLSNCANLEYIRSEVEATEQGYFDQPLHAGSRSRRSTLQSQSSFSETSSVLSGAHSPVDQVPYRMPPRRKPRKFMSGSTQLKPLLLPTLTGDMSVPSPSSTSPSPQMDALQTADLDIMNSTETLLTTSSNKALNTVQDESDSSLVSFVSQQSGDETMTVPHNLADLMAGYINDTLTSPTCSMLSEISSTPNRPFIDLTMPKSRGDRVVRNDLVQVDSISPPDFRDGSGSETTSFNLQALKNLELPSPQYDELPSKRSYADETLLGDIPEPLFSPSHGFSSQYQQPRYHNSTDPFRQHEWELRHRDIPQGSLRSSLDFGRAAKIPISKCHQRSHTNACVQASRCCFASQLSPLAPVPRSDFSQLPSSSDVDRLTMTKSPLNLIQLRKLGPRPLAALTIRTIFNTISQCTTQVKDLQRDPLMLARRVLTNAWFSNWKRFGKLSWWVLGLFIRTGLGGPRLREWSWESYDGEEIARRACQEHHDQPATDNLNSRAMQTEQSTSLVSIGVPPISEPGWRKSAVLWGKFSIAIMLAVGGAVVKGPGEMLKEIEPQKNNLETSSSKTERVADVEFLTEHHLQDTIQNQHRMLGRYCDQHVITPLIQGASTSSLGIRTGSMSPANGITPFGRSRQELYPDEDHTVRANPGPRKRVADYFQQQSPGNSSHPHDDVDHVTCHPPYIPLGNHASTQRSIASATGNFDNHTQQNDFCINDHYTMTSSRFTDLIVEMAFT